MLPRFGLDFELKTVDTTERIIEGYAAIAETIDRVADVIDRKAFSRVQSKAPGDVAVFIAHNMDALPVGIPIDIRFDGTGLWTKTKVFNTHAGDDLLAVAHELKAHGKSLGMSIGYKVMPDGAVRERNSEGKTVRRLLDIDIKEYSFAPSLTIAHPDALVTNVKALSEGLDTAGGYLTEEVISHLRKMHTVHCKDDNCPLIHDDGDGEPDDGDDDKTVDTDTEAKAESDITAESKLDVKLEEWFKKCTGAESYYRRNDINTASGVLQALTQWIESELTEGDDSKKHVRALYRALVIVSNTLRSEIDEYYAGAGAESESSSSEDGEVVVEGGKTRPIEEIMLGVVDLDITLAHVR